MWDSHSPSVIVYILCVGVQRIGVRSVHHRHCILVPLVEHLLLFLGELVVELKEELFRIRIPLREQLVCKGAIDIKVSANFYTTRHTTLACVLRYLGRPRRRRTHSISS